MIIKSNKKEIANTFQVKLPNKNGSEYTLYREKTLHKISWSSNR